MNEALSADVIVLGLGPAGRAFSHRARTAGLDVIAIDPHPDRRWTPTYSAWSDELPEWLPSSVIGSVTNTPAAFTTKRQPIDRTYCVLDTAALQISLDIENVRVVAGTAMSVTSTSVTTSDGTMLTSRHVVDARGSMGLSGLAEQTAYGVVLAREAAEPLLEGVGAWFMDWRYDNGTCAADVPSFLYAVALGESEILLEETCLVGRPPLDHHELKQRLHTRLRNRGLSLSGSEHVERVRFSVQPPAHTHGDRQVIRFGARSSMMHPATGYSVAASLAAADGVVDAVQRSKGIGTPSIWAVQRLRNLGLRTALGLDPALVPHFFASFFALPVKCQKAYLSGGADAVGTALAMARMFPTLPTDARIAIARTVMGR